MDRVVLSVGPGVGVSATEVAAAWDADALARGLGSALVEVPGPGLFLPGVVVGGLLARFRAGGGGCGLRVEVSETATVEGRTLVRAGREGL